MDKTMLEKRIEERAEKRFTDDLRSLINDIQKNPIGKSLKILINGEENKNFKDTIYLEKDN